MTTKQDLSLQPTQSHFKSEANAALFKTAKSRCSCAEFGADEYVGIRFDSVNTDGVYYFQIVRTQQGKTPRCTVIYPEHHLSEFCL